MSTSDKLAWLLVFVGAMLIAAGCARPLDTAVVTANTAAAALVEARATLIEHRAKAQREAAKRVKGSRSDPSVRQEQLDRAEMVGRRYRPAFQSYETARKFWVAAVATIKVAQRHRDAGVEPNLEAVASALAELAEAQKRLYSLVHELTGFLGDGPPKEDPWIR